MNDKFSGNGEKPRYIPIKQSSLISPKEKDPEKRNKLTVESTKDAAPYDVVLRFWFD